MGKNIRRSNTYLIGVKKERRKRKRGNICNNNADNFSELIKDMNFRFRNARLPSKMSGAQGGVGRGGADLHIATLQ